MKTNLTLSVSNPCSEKWESFVPSSIGGFCTACSKTVVDFTKMSEQEIAYFFLNKPVHSCGRFRADQLKSHSPLRITRVTPGATLFMLGLLSLLLFVGATVSAQTNNPSSVPRTSQSSNQEKGLVTSNNRERIINGRVVSPENGGEPLPGVNVVLKHSEIGTVSDVSGMFTFPIKLKEGDVLTFSFVGHETQEYIVTKDIVENIKITLEMNLTAFEGDIIVTGEVAVGDIYHHKSRLGNLLSKVAKVF